MNLSYSEVQHYGRILCSIIVLSILSASTPVLSHSSEEIISTSDDPSKFTAKGLHYEEIMTNIHSGKFEHIGFDREEQGFTFLFNAYITAYAKGCASSLPSDKIELTQQECETWSVTKNGYGVEISRYCISYRTIGTGLYAAPDMYNAKLVLDDIVAGDTFRNLYKMISQENAIENAFSTIGDLRSAINDMEKLVRINGCNSEGLKRFQENLRLFALNKQPIRLDGGSTKSSSSTTTGNQNFPKLVEDLVYAQSKKWVMNRYESGSVSNVRVVSRDNQNRPTKITANYVFQGFSGRSSGSVTLTYKDGLPNCLYFYDFPNTCRTPDRRIVTSYANGGYN